MSLVSRKGTVWERCYGKWGSTPIPYLPVSGHCAFTTQHDDIAFYAIDSAIKSIHVSYLLVQLLIPGVLLLLQGGQLLLQGGQLLLHGVRLLLQGVQLLVHGVQLLIHGVHPLVYGVNKVLKPRGHNPVATVGLENCSNFRFRCLGRRTF